MRIKFLIHDLDYEELTDYRKLYKYLKKRLIDGKMTYIFLDEVQNVTDFPKVLDSLYIKKNIDIYVTGSNAYLLSTEFSTLLSGRYVEIHMLPLSFKEFLDFYEFAPDISIEEKFQKYLQFGGMPILREYRFNEARNMQALEGIYSTVILRNILQRNTQSNQGLLHKLMLFLCSNIGSITSPSSIGNV